MVQVRPGQWQIEILARSTKELAVLFLQSQGKQRLAGIRNLGI